MPFDNVMRNTQPQTHSPLFLVHNEERIKNPFNYISRDSPA